MNQYSGWVFAKGQFLLKHLSWLLCLVFLLNGCSSSDRPEDSSEVPPGTESDASNSKDNSNSTDNSQVPDASEADPVSLDRSNWLLSSSNAPNDLVKAVDGELSTRWTTREYQTPGQYFQIEFPKALVINQIVLKSKDEDSSAGDHPRSLNVEVSDDGNEWELQTTLAGDANGITQIDMQGVQARFVKLTQLGESSKSWWSIHEINVYSTTLLDSLGSEAQVVLDGAELYRINCRDCHNELTSTLKPNRKVEQIQWAINNINVMKSLSGLTPEMILAIEQALGMPVMQNPIELDEERVALVARLTKSQYINTLQDTLNLQLTAGEINQIPATLINESGFSTNVEIQSLSTTHVRAYADIARSLTDRLEIEDFVADLAGCDNVGRACRNAVVDQLGLKLFRRPLNSNERTLFRALFDRLVNLSSDSVVPRAFEGLFEAMLQSPQFLYRIESEEGALNGSVSGYELASRLSYFIWQSAPDSALFDFAQSVNNNGLVQSGLMAQVNRMLVDVKAQRGVDTFWGDYTRASYAGYAGASNTLARDLRDSLITMLRNASGFSGANESVLTDLFSMTEMIFTPAVAALLDIPSEGAGLRTYDTENLPDRTGFITHPGFIAAFGTDSFVGRGVALTEKVLCRKIDDPPSGLDEEIDDVADEIKDLTPRQASDFRFSLGGSCASCHMKFEPIAFGFERLDELGRYRERDVQNRPLEHFGYLQGSHGEKGESYNDSTGLMMILKNLPEASRCFAENMMHFSSGRLSHSEEAEIVESIHSDHLSNGGTFKSLVRAIVAHPSFRSINRL